MMISTKGRYALRVLVDMAEHPSDGYIPLKDIARRLPAEKAPGAIYRGGDPAGHGGAAGPGGLSGAGCGGLSPGGPPRTPSWRETQAMLDC